MFIGDLGGTLLVICIVKAALSFISFRPISLR